MKGHERQKAEVDRFGGRDLCRRFPVFASNLLEAVPDLEEVFGEEGFGDGLIVDTDTFADEAKVGRSIETNLCQQSRRNRLRGSGDVLCED